MTQETVKEVVKYKDSKDFFQSITLSGKYATYARWLTFLPTQQKDSPLQKPSADIFGKLTDLYLLAPIIAVERGIQAPTNDDSQYKDDTITISNTESSKELQNLEYVYNLTLLSHDKKQDPTTKLQNTFKTPYTEQNIKIFTSYLNAGIQYLYTEFENLPKGQHVNKVYELCKDFRDEYWV